MIPVPSHPHRASYDADGNIILPFEPVREVEIEEGDLMNFAEEEIIDVPSVSVLQPMREAMQVIPERVQVLRDMAHEALRESVRQYEESLKDSADFLEKSSEKTKSLLGRAWVFLRQPVWVPGRKKTVAQHSRIGLFGLDILRFGGTFAAIFIALFVALNAQSFWQISSARLASFFTPPSLDAAGTDRPSALTRTLEGSKGALLAQAPEGALISYLPEVGPPQNTLIIPKLNLTVPLVSPPLESLLAENWKQVEEDIQDGLAHGVVHYPGTARPGQAGNFFVTGHSSYYPWAEGEYKTVFARLQELEVGDEYWVYFNGDKHRYVVEEKKEVKPSDITVLDQPTDKRMATLMTCSPVGTTLRRLILTAQEVDPVTAVALEPGEHGERTDRKIKLDALPI